MIEQGLEFSKHTLFVFFYKEANNLSEQHISDFLHFFWWGGGGEVALFSSNSIKNASCWFEFSGAVIHNIARQTKM